MRREGTRSLSGGFGAEPPFHVHRLGAAIVVGNDQGESTGTPSTGHAALAVAPPDLRPWFDLLQIRAETRGAESTSCADVRTRVFRSSCRLFPFLSAFSRSPFSSSASSIRAFVALTSVPWPGISMGRLKTCAIKLKTKGQRRSVPMRLASS